MRDHDYQRVRDYTETLISLNDEKAIHLDEVARIYNAQGTVYFSLGEYDKMEDAFQKTIAQESDSVFVWNIVRRNYADMLGEIGQPTAQSECMKIWCRTIARLMACR